MERRSLAEADFSCVHFTDTHIMAGGTWAQGQIDMAVTLGRVIEVIIWFWATSTRTSTLPQVAGVVYRKCPCACSSVG